MNPPKHLLVRKPVPFAHDESGIADQGYLGYLGRLEGEPQYIQPTFLPVYFNPDKKREDQQEHRDRKRDAQQRVKPARQIVHQQYEHKTAQHECCMPRNRFPMRHALISDRTGRTENLDRRNQAQEHEYNPYHPVAFEQFAC